MSFAGSWTVRESPYPTSTAAGTIAVHMRSTPLGGLVLGETTNEAVPNGGSTKILSSDVELSPVLAGQPALLTEVVMHELAHAVGAAHSNMPGSVTFFEVDGSATEFASWEVSSLQRLTGATCATSPYSRKHSRG